MKTSKRISPNLLWLKIMLTEQISPCFTYLLKYHTAIPTDVISNTVGISGKSKTIAVLYDYETYKRHLNKKKAVKHKSDVFVLFFTV
jgi:hypothetical protein